MNGFMKKNMNPFFIFMLYFHVLYSFMYFFLVKLLRNVYNRIDKL